MVGVATDIYLHGIHYAYVTISFFFMILPVLYVFLPVIHDLKMTSIYEYLELRFNKQVRLFGSVLFALRIIVNLPIYIYLPAITFSQVSGIDHHYVGLLVTVVCIFYTCVGGLKAVVWTDVVQALCMFGAVILVVIKSTNDVGGVSVVWQRGVDGERLEPPDWSFDFTRHYTIWSLVIGMFCVMLQLALFNQSMAQRYMSLPRLGTAKVSVVMLLVGLSLFMVFVSYFGLVVYATYYDCDPVRTKVVQAMDQVVPLIVMRTLGDYPGLPGIFVAGVFSAALSTLSSCLNSMSAVVLEDFYSAFSSKTLTDNQKHFLMKAVVVVFGLVGFGLIFVVEKLGSVLRVVMTIGVMADGPLVAIFSMGFLLPWVNSKGVLAGGIVGIAAYIWISMGAYVALITGRSTIITKPLSVAGCTNNLTAITTTPLDIDSDVFILYRISYMWYVPLACLVTTVVGVMVSFMAGANDPGSVDRRLLSPVIRKFLPKTKSDRDGTDYKSVSTYELEILHTIENDGKKELPWSKLQ